MTRLYKYKIDLGATVHPEVEAESQEEADQLAEDRAREIVADWLNVRKMECVSVTPEPDEEE